LEPLLKRVLKRQVPYLIGGTITGIIITYYYGFLFSIIVNSIGWFLISTIVNKLYWHYTGFKEEFYLASKYIIHRKKNRANGINDTYKGNYKKETQNSSNPQSLLENIDDKTSDNVGSPIK
jgi:hypothetical protein